MALLVNERERISPDIEKAVRPNVILFDLDTKKKKRWYVVGSYLPPLDTGGGGREGTMASIASSGEAAGRGFAVEVQLEHQLTDDNRTSAKLVDTSVLEKTEEDTKSFKNVMFDSQETRQDRPQGLKDKMLNIQEFRPAM